MRVVLVVRSGRSAGRRIWLQRGQVLQVGSTEDADFVVAEDPDMAPVHFSLRTDQHGCHLEDLETEQGTLVNGEPVDHYLLADGDQIQAGQTTMIVRVDGAAPRDGTEAAAPARRKAPPKASATATVPCVEQSCGSGMILLEGTAEEAAPADVLAAIAERWPAYLVADFARLKQPIPEEIAEPRFLLSWLAPEVQSHHSPLVFVPGEESTLAMVDAAWGKDAAVWLFSRGDPEEIVAQLRRAACYNPSTGVQAEGETVLAFWWPNIFRLVLTHSPARHVDWVLQGIDGVLLEGADRAGWQVYGRPEFVEQLKQMGFEVPPPPTDETTPATEEALDGDANVSSDQAATEPSPSGD